MLEISLAHNGRTIIDLRVEEEATSMEALAELLKASLLSLKTTQLPHPEVSKPKAATKRSQSASDDEPSEVGLAVLDAAIAFGSPVNQARDLLDFLEQDKRWKSGSTDPATTIRYHLRKYENQGLVEDTARGRVVTEKGQALRRGVMPDTPHESSGYPSEKTIEQLFHGTPNNDMA